MPSLWERFKKSSVAQDYLSPAWDWATTPLADDRDFDNKFVDIAYDELLRPLTTPLGIAASAAPLLRGGKYLKRGIVDKPTPVAATAPPAGSKAHLKSIPETLKDETKQIAMTFGLPGTGINSHSIALATAHLKGTPIKKLPKEAWDTARMLYNPERAVAANKKLTGGFSPKQKREEFDAFIQQQAPGLTPTQRSHQVENLLDAYASSSQGTRFKDILELERKEKLGGGGLKTSDILGGSSKGTVPERAFLTTPLRVGGDKGINLNPFHWQKEMFDTPTFGEEYLNTYFKRQTALDELDRIKGNPSLTRQEQLKQAADFSTSTLGGYGIDSPSPFNSAIAKWTLTAPDWTRRHFDLAGKKVNAVLNPKTWGDQKYAPYRRYAGYDAATLGGAAAANYAINEELPQRAVDIFNVELPQDRKNAKRDVIAPMSTEMDLPKAGFDIYNAMTEQYAPETKGLDSAASFWRHRIHPFSRAALDVVDNHDWRGRRLMGEEAYSKPKTDMLGNTTFERPDIPLAEEFSRVGENTVANVLPQAADALANLYSGNKSKSGKKQMSDLAKWAQLFELPIRSYTPRYSQVETPFDREVEALERIGKFRF